MVVEVFVKVDGDVSVGEVDERVADITAVALVDGEVEEVVLIP